MHTPEDLLKLLNDSGYPLQLAVQGIAETLPSNHRWWPLYAEHSWHHHHSHQSGYLDLVLQAQDTFLLVECKRVRHAAWLFFHARGKRNFQRQVKMWVSTANRVSLQNFGWGDVTAEPPTPEANFCALRGQSSSERTPLLERTAAELALATESFARENWPLRDAAVPSTRFYASAIVTTATLRLATFDISDIALHDGTVSAADFTDVPFIRFRKQVLPTTHAELHKDPPTQAIAAYEKESTVFVVNAQHFGAFLEQFRVSNTSRESYSVA